MPSREWSRSTLEPLVQDRFTAWQILTFFLDNQSINQSVWGNYCFLIAAEAANGVDNRPYTESWTTEKSVANTNSGPSGFITPQVRGGSGGRGSPLPPSITPDVPDKSASDWENDPDPQGLETFTFAQIPADFCWDLLNCDATLDQVKNAKHF